MADLKTVRTDVVIVGAGLAGLRSAIAAAEEGVQVALLSKGPVGKSGCSPMYNGGYNIVDPSMKDPITYDDYLKQVLKVGMGLNDQELIWLIITNGLTRLKELEERGANVAYGPERFVAHIHGVVMVSTMKRWMEEYPNITAYDDMLVTKILTKEGGAVGAMALNMQSGEVVGFESKAVVMASGGYSELWPVSSNKAFGMSAGTTGTGGAMAYHAGADLVDLEMENFVSLPGATLALGLRYGFWEGPYVNSKGEVFVTPDEVYAFPGVYYSYKLAERMMEQIEKGNGPLFIDGTKRIEGKPRGWGEDRTKQYHQMGISPYGKKSKVTIGSHFSQGGIRINEEGETTVPGLYAIGEVAGNVHGAMRYMGMSGPHMLVLGERTGRGVGIFVKSIHAKPIDQKDIAAEHERLQGLLKPKTQPVSPIDLRNRIWKVMAEDVFVFRDEKRLLHALDQIRGLKRELPRLQAVEAEAYNLDLYDAVEVAYGLDMAELVILSALYRKESRGTHNRRDYPNMDNRKWLVHTVVRKRNGAEPELTTTPVQTNRVPLDELEFLLKHEVSPILDAYRTG